MEFSSTVVRGHSGPIYALAVDENYVYSSSSDRFVTRWNLQTHEQDAFAVKLDAPAYTISLHHHFLFIGTTNGAVRCINLQTKSLVWESNRFGNPIFSLCWSEELQLLLVGDSEGNLFAIHEDGKPAWYFPLNSGKIRVIEEIGTHFYVGSQDGNVRCFQATSLNEIWMTQAHEGSVYALIKTENGLLSAGYDGCVTHILEPGTIRKKLPVHYQAVYALSAFEGGFVTCSKDKTIKVWDKAWKCLSRLEGAGHHLRSINALVVVKEGFISASDDKTIRFWKRS